MKRFYIVVNGEVQAVLGTQNGDTVQCGSYGTKTLAVDVWYNRENAEASLTASVRMYGGARGGGKASRDFATVYDQLHKERLAVKRQHLEQNNGKA